MHSVWNILKMAMLVGLLLAAGCGGGGTSEPDPQEATGNVAGTITVAGSELLELGSGNKIETRLIEDIEDIDSVEIETSEGIMSSTPVSPGMAKLLQVSLLPGEDLTGGSAASTPVTLSLPLAVEENQTTNVALEVQFEQEGASASKAGSQAGLPWLVRMRYTITGPGATMKYLRIRWQDGVVQYDSNMNDSFEDEDSFPDGDRDGLSNDLREIISDQASDRLPVERSGTITSINQESHSITLNDSQVVRINEITRIRRNGQQARPAQLHPGDSCTVVGFQDGDDLFLRALTIDATGGSDVSSGR